jgi:hypothetical protein
MSAGSVLDVVQDGVVTGWEIKARQEPLSRLTTRRVPNSRIRSTPPGGAPEEWLSHARKPLGEDRLVAGGFTAPRTREPEADHERPALKWKITQCPPLGAASGTRLATAGWTRAVSRARRDDKPSFGTSLSTHHADVGSEGDWSLHSRLLCVRLSFLAHLPPSSRTENQTEPR